MADFRIIQDIVKNRVKRGAISKIREVHFFSIPIRYPKQGLFFISMTARLPEKIIERAPRF